MLLSDLVYDVRPDVAGAPDFTIRDALKKSAVEFFYESQCWMEQLDPIPLVAGTRSYDFSLPSDSLLLRLYADGNVSGVKIGQRCLQVAPEWDLFDARRDAAAVGEPRICAIVTSADTLLVWPTPGADDAGKSVSILAVLGLVRDADEIPDSLGLRWRAAIIENAKAKLMNTAGKPWSNPAQGALEYRAYRGKIASARAEAHTGRYAGPQRYTFPTFA